MQVAGIVLTALLSLVFAGSGATKLLRAAPSLRIRDDLRISAGLWTTVGVLEVAAVVGLVAGLRWEWMAIAAAIGLAALMAAAAAVHRRADDARGQLPPLVLLVLSAALAVMTANEMA
jgi:hypothetical protein